MHKIPASLGLGTYLQHSGLCNKEIFFHLLAFTLTCPLSNILTYIIFRSLGMQISDQKDLGKAVGILLLFSAGTFLYVSTIHILPEVYCKPHNEEDACEQIKNYLKKEDDNYESIIAETTTGNKKEAVC